MGRGGNREGERKREEGRGREGQEMRSGKEKFTTTSLIKIE